MKEGGSMYAIKMREKKGWRCLYGGEVALGG